MTDNLSPATCRIVIDGKAETGMNADAVIALIKNASDPAARALLEVLPTRMV